MDCSLIFMLLSHTGLQRLPRAAAGTIKVSKKTKARAVALIAKMPDDAMSSLSAGSPMSREMMAKKRPQETGM